MRIITCCVINARSRKHCQKIFHFYVSTLGFHSLTQAMEQSCVIMDVAQTFALNVTLRRVFRPPTSSSYFIHAHYTEQNSTDFSESVLCNRCHLEFYPRAEKLDSLYAPLKIISDN